MHAYIYIYIYIYIYTYIYNVYTCLCRIHPISLSNDVSCHRPVVGYESGYGRSNYTDSKIKKKNTTKWRYDSAEELAY